jgi:hypothetical protein
MKTILLLILTATLGIAGEPRRDDGLSVHMLPDSVAKQTNGHGGFTVSDPATNRPVSTYVEPKDVLVYFQQLPSAVQHNGIWIITTDPGAYSDSEQAKLKVLVGLCVRKKIPIYS